MDELPISVLIVSAPEACERVRAILRSATNARFDVEWVSDPAEAAECLGVPCYDVCLTVHADGEIDGPSVVRTVRESGCPSPVVVLTESEVPGMRDAAMAAGATEVLPEDGVSPELLACVLRHALRTTELGEALRQAVRENAQFAAGLAALPGGVVLTDPTLPDDPVVFVNPGFERLTGYAADEVIGRNCRFLQGEGTDPRVVAEVARAITERRSLTRTLLNYKKDGTPFWNELRLSPIFAPSGELVNFVGLQRDVTAEREAATRLESTERCLVDLLGRLDAPAAIHRDGRLLHANGALAALLGYDDVATLEGRAMIDIVHPKDRERLADGHHEVEAHGCSTCERTVRLARADGTEVEVKLECTPVSYEGAPAVLDRVV